MTWHPTDDELILHFYGEDAQDERRVDEHLHSCSTCRDTWVEISETLKMVDVAAIPEPADGFERVMWARVQRSLPERSAARAWWAPRWLVPAAGFAALVVATVVGVNYWPAAPTTPQSPSTAEIAKASNGTAWTPAALAKARERVLLAAAGGHFEQAEMVLVELMNAEDGGQTNLWFERETAGDLVTAGRLYRETARQNGDAHLAMMLDDLEAILIEVSHTPEKVGRQDLRSLRARIDHDSVLFKVRAVSNEIRERQRTLSTE